MTDVLHCIRGCTRHDRHLPDCPHDTTCHGCEPRSVETGYLCAPCIDRLHTLLGPPNETESIAWVCAWLATNLGQHIRHTSGGTPHGDGSTRGDHLVSVIDALNDLQLGTIEIRDHFAQDRGMRPATTTDVATVTAWMRPWLTTLADWEPIGDALHDWLRWRENAHAIAPWRGRHPDATLQAAAALYLAPPETTDQIRDRFRLTPDRLKKLAHRHGLQPIDPHEKPRRWRPWDVYRILHRQTADEYEAQLARDQQGIVWSSDDDTRRHDAA